MSEREQATSPRSKTPEEAPAKRIALGIYLLLMAVLLALSVFVVWPVDTSGDGNWDTSVRLLEDCGIQVAAEARLLLLVILIGALGSYVHASTSFASFVGNESLRYSWAWWYILRPFIGMALAMIFYFVIRGGLLSTGADTEDVSVYGVAAVAGLVGMFSKQATDKLEEVFSTMFRTGKGVGDDARKDKLDDLVPVARVMIPVDNISRPRIGPGDAFDQLKVRDLLKMLGQGVTRIPLLDAEDRARFVIHDSLLYKYVTEQVTAGKQFDPESTLGPLLQHAKFATLVSAIAFVSLDAKLTDAKKAMDGVESCRDVFVTKTGKETEAVEGWLTNIEIGKAISG